MKSLVGKCVKDTWKTENFLERGEERCEFENEEGRWNAC